MSKIVFDSILPQKLKVVPPRKGMVNYQFLLIKEKFKKTFKGTWNYFVIISGKSGTGENYRTLNLVGSLPMKSITVACYQLYFRFIKFLLSHI